MNVLALSIWENFRWGLIYFDQFISDFQLAQYCMQDLSKQNIYDVCDLIKMANRSLYGKAWSLTCGSNSIKLSITLYKAHISVSIYRPIVL